MIGKWPEKVESFPLTVGQVFQQYTRLPTDASNVLYHYTTRTGLDGILKSGGLRATYRMRMNDAGEFDYARSLVFDTLNMIGERHDLPPVGNSLASYTSKNLDLRLKDTVEMSSAYCACLSVASDHPKQWETYAEGGKGFALGIDIFKLLENQRSAVECGKPFLFCAPVSYKEAEQRDLVWRLVKAGINDLQTFSEKCSWQPEDLTALRNRITEEIILQLLVLIDFIKAPTYSSERELRLILDPNDVTLKARNIQHYQRNNETISFIFMDFRMPDTKRLSLAEIKIGPMASFYDEKVFLEGLLNELGYGSNYGDQPRITQSASRCGK
ncbi:MAG: DUF2971 domain-containing protein [Deltaproteobacteria bacterium]|nr:DUF2971 domain-containing protein [Deltaproteobacteria bacterium]